MLQKRKKMPADLTEGAKKLRGTKRGDCVGMRALNSLQVKDDFIYPLNIYTVQCLRNNWQIKASPSPAWCAPTLSDKNSAVLAVKSSSLFCH